MNRPLMNCSILGISSEMDVTRAALESGKIARTMGFDDNKKSMIATAVSELAGNIIKYAEKGDILFKEVAVHHQRGIEIIVRDNGPGIEDVEHALADHYSSGGTLGLGLPGVKRLMDEFEIQSAVGKGTTITIKKWI